ncbi:dipeptidase 2 [Phaethornis superciliosus]
MWELSAWNKDAVHLTLEQIDVVKRMCNSYEELELVTTSQVMCVEYSYVTLANSFPEGLEDVSKYPSLIEELLRRGWNETELKGVLGQNFLCVFREVENVRNISGLMDVGESEILQEVQNSCHLDLHNYQLQTIRSFRFPSVAQSFILILVIVSHLILYHELYDL